MLYNKRQIQEVDCKKKLHKIGKFWTVISIALLGAMGTKAVTTHANANTNTSANHDAQANHQIGNLGSSVSAQLVKSNGASLASDRQGLQTSARTYNNSSSNFNDRLSHESQTLYQKIVNKQKNSQASLVSSVANYNSVAKASISNDNQIKVPSAFVSMMSNAGSQNNVGTQSTKMMGENALKIGSSDVSGVENNLNNSAFYSANQQISNLVNEVVRPNLISAAVERLVNEPGDKQAAFEGLVNNAKAYLSNDNNASSFINDFVNDNNFKQFNGIDAKSTKYIHIFNRLMANPITKKVIGQYYQDAQLSQSSLDNILRDSVTIAQNPYNDGKNKVKSALSDINSTIVGSNTLKNIPGFNNIAAGAIDAKNGYVPATKPPMSAQADVSLIAGMMPAILNRLTAPSNDFNHTDFDSAIEAITSNHNLRNNNSLLSLWNAIDANKGIQDFLGRRGILTSQITGLLHSDNPTIESLEAAYQQTHTDGNVSRILTDLKSINDNYTKFDANGRNGAVQNALSDIASSINDPNDSTLRSIKGMQVIANNAASDASDYVPINLPISKDMVNAVLNKLTTSNNSEKIEFINAIHAAQSALNSQDSLSNFWNSVKSNPSVKAFIARHGNLTNTIVGYLTNSANFNNAYQIAHNDAGNVNHILDKLISIVNSPLNVDGNNDQIDTNIKDIADTITHDPKLNAIGGLRTVAITAYNDINHHTVTVTPSVSIIGQLLPRIIDQVTAKGFNSSDFNSAIEAIKSNLSGNDSLLGLWTAISNNQGVQNLLKRYGTTIKRVTDILSHNNSLYEKLNAAYAQVHKDPQLTTILSDVEQVAKHQQLIKSLSSIKHILTTDHKMMNIDGVQNGNQSIIAALNNEEQKIYQNYINTNLDHYRNVASSAARVAQNAYHSASGSAFGAGETANDVQIDRKGLNSGANSVAASADASKAASDAQNALFAKNNASTATSTASSYANVARDTNNIAKASVAATAAEVAESLAQSDATNASNASSVAKDDAFNALIAASMAGSTSHSSSNPFNPNSSNNNSVNQFYASLSNSINAASASASASISAAESSANNYEQSLLTNIAERSNNSNAATTSEEESEINRDQALLSTESKAAEQNLNNRNVKHDSQVATMANYDRTLMSQLASGTNADALSPNSYTTDNADKAAALAASVVGNTYRLLSDADASAASAAHGANHQAKADNGQHSEHYGRNGSDDGDKAVANNYGNTNRNNPNTVNGRLNQSINHQNTNSLPQTGEFHIDSIAVALIFLSVLFGIMGRAVDKRRYID